MVPLRRFITALAVLLACLGLYSFVVAPWFEPPPITRKAGAPEMPSAATSTRRDRNLASLFEPGSWELGNPKIVENDDCTLLIQDYKPLDDGRMELRPCTLIFYLPADAPDENTPALPDGTKPTPPRRPIVMRAPQGAILQFDRPLDLGKAQFGRVIGGRLAGDITIFSPESKPGANDALRLSTRNVQIDTERAFTPHDVEFSYGKSYGRGRDMTIYLLPSESTSAGKSSTPIGGVRALQLAHVEKLHLELDTPGLMPDMSAGDAVATKTTPDKPGAPLEVRCKGPLVYDFEHKIIALDDQVELTRVYPAGPPDRLLCSKLMLYLAPPSGVKPEADRLQTAASATPASGAAGMTSKLYRVVAVGSPVVLEAPSSSTFVVASRIEYSPPTRRLALESGDGAKQVVLEREQDKFEARTLEAELAADGKRLGRLWAAGPGRLRLTHSQESKPETIAAQWDKELWIRPDQKCQVISLVRGAAVEVGSNGSFAADELHVWVLEVPADETSAAGRTAGSTQKGKSSIVPDRLLALGNVRVDSPQLRASTNRLEGWFVDVPLPPSASAAANAYPSPSSPPPAAQPAPIRPPVAGAPAPMPQPNGGATPPPPAGPQPAEVVQQFTVNGEKIQMQIARDGDRTALEALTIQGGVEIVETQTASPGESPLRIKGDALQLRDGATDNAKLEVHGKPAEVTARGLTLSGPSIHLHRGENRLWIDGPGKATLPVPTDEKRIDPPPTSAEKMNVFWRRSMVFDGRTASLVGEVQATSSTQRALSETLEVTLARPVDFSNPETGGGETEVAHLKFDGGVDLENTTLDPLGERISVEQLQVRNLMIDRRTGALSAEGPGWLTSIRKGGAEGLMQGPAGSQPLPVPAAQGSGLTHLHIQFEGGIGGDVNKHEITFQNRVKAIYATVADWDQRITMNDLDRGGLAALGENGALLSSDQLTVREMLPSIAQVDGKKWIEMIASKNVMVEGKSFTARADRISYTTDKEQLVLQGDGRNDAELWHQQVKGGQYSYTAATKIMYWRGKNEVVFEGGKVLDLQQIGKPPPSPLNRLR